MVEPRAAAPEPAQRAGGALDPAITLGAGLALAVAQGTSSWGAEWLALGLVVALAGLWGWRQLQRQPSVAWPLLVAVALLVLVAVPQRLARPRDQPVDGAFDLVGQAFRDQLDELARQAQQIAGDLAIPRDSDQRLAVFRRLEEIYGTGGGSAASTLQLVDRDGNAVAWTGEGLRHDLRGPNLPAAGISFVSSFTAVTLFAVAPIEDTRRPWRVIAGRSYSTAELPFGDLGFRPLTGPAWSVRQAGAPDGGENWLDLASEGYPVLRLPISSLVQAGKGPWAERLPWLLFSLGLFGVALATALSALDRRSVHRLPALAIAYAVIAIASAGAGLAADPRVLCAFVASGGLLALCWGTAYAIPTPVASAAVAVASAASALAVAMLGQRWIGPTDLGERFWLDSSGWLLRGAVGSLVICGVIGRRRGVGGLHDSGSPRWSERWLWVAAPIVGVALIAVETSWLAIVLLLAAAGCAGLWRSGWLGAGELARLAVVAALIASALCHVGYRRELRSRLATLIESSDPEQHAATVQRFFETLDVARLALGDPDRLTERIDLPLALWRASPLAASTGRSAIWLVPGDGVPSIFSFGLSIDSNGERTSEQSGRWSFLAQPAVTSEVRSGSEPLLAQGKFWGRVLYWWTPPVAGVDWRSRLEGGGLARALLTASPEELELEVLPGGARLHRDAQTSSALPPGRWRRVSTKPRAPWMYKPVEAPANVADEDSSVNRLAGAGDQDFENGELAAEGRAAEVATIELPVPGPLEAWIRVGLQTVAICLALLALVSLVVPLALAVPAPRARLVRISSSYSRKLVLIFTLLLVVPGALLNLFLLRSVESRLTDERKADGEAALASASYIIEDYLQTLDPGFSIEAELDDPLMTWLARVVSHEVNLYWRGEVKASSRPELFDAGLMPKRIPGEVFSRLGLAGEPLAARVNRTVTEVSYLELYSPLALPGGGGSSGLFLSVPLLAQEEAAARQIRQLTHQAVIVTAFLVLLLLLVGARLAARFSQPLRQLVEGTDRIARGATSLGLEPREPELSALAEAIDAMARRIHDARNNLLAEKQVVDAVVANINSAVVSLDGELRVQMCNRLARDLLGVEVGQALTEVSDSRLGQPLAQLAAERPSSLARRTVVLQEPSGEAKEWTIVWVPVAGGGEPSALVVIEDVTEILSGQRLEAWAEMARMIAHEVKNPLTPIRLSAEHLRRVYQQAPQRLDEVFDRCIDNILEQVSELRETAAEFSTFSRIRGAAFELKDVIGVVRQVVEGYQTSPPQGIEIRFAAPEAAVSTVFDERLIARAVRNLLENAIHASAAGGTVEVEVAVASPTLAPSAQSGSGPEVVITVRDRGPGVAIDNLGRIFEPNFSTSSGGTGLGLAITRRIADEHGGTVSAVNREGGGLLVTLRFPVAESLSAPS